MRLLFLAPLLTGLLSAYIARRSQDEMAYLTGAVAGVSLLISLMIAPWQVQLILLLLVVSTVGYVWKQNGIEDISEVQQFQSTIQSRVGMANGKNPSEVIPSSVTLNAKEVIDKRKVRKYRGVLIAETPSQPATTPSKLKYRGASVNDPSQDR